MADGPPPSSYFSMPFASDSHRSRTQGWPKNIFAFSGPWKIFGTTAEWCRPISFSRNAWNRVLSISAEEQEVKTDPTGLVLSQKLYPIRTDLLKKLLALRITTKYIKITCGWLYFCVTAPNMLSRARWYQALQSLFGEDNNLQVEFLSKSWRGPKHSCKS